jgi:hypothetical protein
MIIVAPGFRSYRGMKTADLDQCIASYLELGGRMVWIGGTSLANWFWLTSGSDE